MATPVVGGSSAPAARPARPPGRIGSEEFHSGTLPTAQEAAVLYACNHAHAAAELLKAEIKDPVGRNNKQAWLMLFDLHQIAQSRQDFDALAMLYTVKFEQSPPAWSDEGESSDPRRIASRDRKDFFALKPNASGELAAEIEKLLAFAEGQGSVRVDVSKVAAITAEEAALLANVLQHLRKKRTPMWFNHLDGLEKVLRTGFNEKATDAQRPYWQLLFELLILQGKATEFEELGLEYAVAFEISPPNWESYVNTVAEAAKASPAPATGAGGRAQPDAGHALKGVISPASANQIAELNNYASSHTEVVVDMSKVLRIEFGYVSSFFDVVKSIQLAGKRVILANLNEVNAALLEAMGVNRYAILVRRKST